MASPTLVCQDQRPQRLLQKGTAEWVEGSAGHRAWRSRCFISVVGTPPFVSSQPRHSAASRSARPSCSELRKLSSLSGTSANDLRRAWQRRSKDGHGPNFLAACTKGPVKCIATRDKAPGASARAAAANSSIPCRRNRQKSRSAGAFPGASSPTSLEKPSTCRRRRSRHGGAPPDAVFRRSRKVTPLLYSSCCWASVARFQRSTASSCNLVRRRKLKPASPEQA